MEKCLGVAQFGSALEWGSRGREFKSPHSDHYKRKLIREPIGLLFFYTFINVKKEDYSHFWRKYN